MYKDKDEGIWQSEEIYKKHLEILKKIEIGYKNWKLNKNEK